MNKEIKEILDKLTDIDWYEEGDLTGTKWIELRQEETNLLYDYIVNLQEENERLKEELYSTNQVVNELLDERDRNRKAYNYLDKFIPNEYGILLTERQWEYIKNILGGDE